MTVFDCSKKWKSDKQWRTVREPDGRKGISFIAAIEATTLTCAANKYLQSFLYWQTRPRPTSCLQFHEWFTGLQHTRTSDNSLLSPLWPARSIEGIVGWVSSVGLWKPLNHIKHPLDDTEQRFRARPSLRPSTSELWPQKGSSGWMGKNLHRLTPQSCKKSLTTRCRTNHYLLSCSNSCRNAFTTLQA